MEINSLTKEKNFLLFAGFIAIVMGIFLVNSLRSVLAVFLFIAFMIFFLLKREIIGFIVLCLVPFDFLGLFEGKLSILKVLAFLYLMPTLFQKLIKHGGVKLDRKIIILVSIYYGVWLIAAELNGHLLDYSLSDLTTVPFWYFLFPLVLVFSFTKEKHITLAITIFTVLCVFEILLGSLQSFLGEKFYIRQLFFSETQEISKQLRIGEVFNSPVGTFTRPYDYAAFLLLPSSIIMALLIGKQIKSKITYHFLLGFFIFGIMISFSRSTYIGLVIVTGLIIYYLKKYQIRLLSKKILYVIALILLVIFVSLLSDDLYNAFMIKIDPKSHAGLFESFEVRKYLWYSSLLAFIENPVLGLGPGNYANNSHIWLSKANSPVYAWGKEAHNAFGELFAEVGLIGGTVMVILLFSIYRNLQYSLKIFRTHNLYLFHITLGIIAYFISQIIGIFLYGKGLVDGSFYISIPFGFSLALKNIANKLVALKINT